MSVNNGLGTFEFIVHSLLKTRIAMLECLFELCMRIIPLDREPDSTHNSDDLPNPQGLRPLLRFNVTVMILKLLYNASLKLKRKYAQL